MEKYLKKAEYIYENYIIDIQRNPSINSIEEDFDNTNLNSTNVSYLERPISQLSKLKVIKIIDNVMQVLDVTNKKCYIMKVIPQNSCSINNHTTIIFLQNIPYMVQIAHFFKTDSSIYLLLKQAW